jgi:4-amino-4-deoxy-L-arabinose transferase-like glycosyltransferase
MSITAAPVAAECGVPEVSSLAVPAALAYSQRPRWILPALWALLGATALLYLWDLAAAGYANQFYAAAVQAGTQSWKALLFGSLDPGNAITVDTPPAAIWVMGLSARLFGFGALAMLVPQALMGVGSVALLYGAVRRASGPIAGLLAGAMLALTPLAALVFRHNTPDALLVLLLVAAGYCTVRSLDRLSGRWLALAGTALGFAVLTETMQALVVLPALGLVVMIGAPGSLRTRIRNLLIGLATTVASAGWFVALVAIWPADSRPYIGGSTDNSLLQLVLADNGVGRAHGGGLAGGSQVSWLLPAALIGLLAMLWVTRLAPRTSRMRASLLLWGAWMLLSGLIFGCTVAMAPGVAAVTAIATRELWRGRQFASSRVTLALMLMATVCWDFVLLGRTPDWLPWPRWAMLLGAVAVTVVLLSRGRLAGRAAVMLCTAGLAFGLSSITAYTIHLVAEHPPVASTGYNRALEALLVGTDNRWAAATVGSHTTDSLELSTGKSVMAVGGFSGRDNSPTLTQFQRYVATGQIHYFIRDDTGGSGTAGQITRWVGANFVPRRVGGVTVYDLTR